MSRGIFIVFEGLDRSGKTTQSTLLFQELSKQGLQCCQMRFPDRTTQIGAIIDGYLGKKLELDDHAIHLLYSANRWEKASDIKKLLTSGTTIICDRYAFSGVAFTAAKGMASLEWCMSPDKGLPKPDVVIYVDIPVNVAGSRSQYGEERYEKAEFQMKVGKMYAQLKDPSFWKIVDGTRGIEAIHQDIMKEVQQVIKSCSSKPVESLWV